MKKNNPFLLCLLLHFLTATSETPLQLIHDNERELIYLGTDYGGWTIPKKLISRNSICYCFGAGQDISFDLELIKYFGCEVYSFDPTPKSIEHIEYIKNGISKNQPIYPIPDAPAYNVDESIMSKFFFFSIGLWYREEIVRFYQPQNPDHASHSIINLQKTDTYFQAPCKKLSTIMRELGHNNITLIKMDIEGAEYPVLINMLEENILPDVLCVELHKTPEFDKNETIQALHNAGYYLVAKPNDTDFTFILNKTSQPKMKIHEYHTDLFENDPVSTEYNAYRLLKEKPLNSMVNYLAIPWAVLINTNQLHKIPEIKLDGGFTVCQHIHFEKIIPVLKKMGIDTLFTPHVSKNKKYDGIKVLPFPHFAVNGKEPAQEKDIYYSFIGYNTHPTREEIFAIKKMPHSVIKERKHWHWQQPANLQAQEKNEYQDILARSQFSLCPRGTGASTLRFWESLQAGAIPVLISDDMSLPEGVNWETCIIRIPEKDTPNLNNKINAVSIQKREKMRKNGLEAFRLSSGEHFVRCIRLHYDQ